MATALQQAQAYSRLPVYECPYCGKLRSSNHAAQCSQNPNRVLHGKAKPKEG